MVKLKQLRFTFLLFGQVTTVFGLLFSVILQSQIWSSFFGYPNKPHLFWRNTKQFRCFFQECEFKRYDFYPGQMLKGPLKLFEDGDYEHCTDELKNARNGGKGNRIFKVTVLKAEVLFSTFLSISCFSVRSFYWTF